MDSNYQKYIKYKTKYLQLKAMIGGEEKGDVNDKLRTRVNQIIESFIVPVLLEMDCCQKDLFKIKVYNNKQKDFTEQTQYLSEMQKYFKDYYDSIQNYIKSIFNGTKEDFISLLQKSVPFYNIQNFEEKNKELIDPLSRKIVKEYVTVIKRLNMYVIDKKIPAYRIKFTNDMERLQENCITVNKLKKCCENSGDTSNCVTQMGATRLTRLYGIITEIKQLIEDNKQDVSNYNHLNNYLMNFRTEIKNNLDEYANIQLSENKYNTKYTNKKIFNKIFSDKFKGIEIIPQRITQENDKPTPITTKPVSKGPAKTLKNIYPIKVLSYNISFQAMIGKAIGTVFKACPKKVDNDKITECLSNVAKYIENTGPYDLIGLQEASNWQDIIKQSKKLQNMKYETTKADQEEMISFYNPNKFTLDDDNAVIKGDFGSGRPIQILFFKQKICFINVHPGHSGDYKNFDNKINEYINKYVTGQGFNKTKILNKLKNYEIIIVGDFNSELTSFDNKLFKFIDNGRTFYGKTDTKTKTCCDSSELVGKNMEYAFDHILYSKEGKHKTQVVGPPLGTLQSDHLPVIASINQ